MNWGGAIIDVFGEKTLSLTIPPRKSVNEIYGLNFM
jgi:hypothetical protein